MESLVTLYQSRPSKTKLDASRRGVLLNRGTCRAISASFGHRTVWSYASHVDVHTSLTFALKFLLPRQDETTSKMLSKSVFRLPSFRSFSVSCYCHFVEFSLNYCPRLLNADGQWRVAGDLLQRTPQQLLIAAYKNADAALR